MTATRLASIVLAGLVLALAGCGGDARPRSTIALAECRLPKLPLAAQCGTLEVPENRDQPDGRRISLAVAVLPANTLHPRADPLFILAGGPGQAASFLGPFAAALTGVRKDRDIVLVDQRGTGRSSPLVCAAFKPDRDLRSDARLRSRSQGGGMRQGARRAGHRRRAIHDGRMGRRPRRRARCAGLREGQPVGRLLRDARGAGVPAPAPGPRAQRRARRRRLAGDEDDPRRLAVARDRAERGVRRLRTITVLRRRASRPRRHARRDPRPAGSARAGRRADRSAHRRGADAAPDVRPRARRAAAVHLRAGARRAPAGSHRPRRRRRLRPAASPARCS